ERTGTYIPRFCYHPRMRPVGMCRMCLVEVDTGRGPSLQPSCMLPVTEGMVVDTHSDTVAKVQDGVLEFLLANHPLDCPVCDKGGECPLQDQTYAYGPGESRHVEEKRHYAKPIPISETIYLDRERCILCDRCTRFADEVAGDPLIHFIDRGSATQVNTFPDEPFSSYFSGNTVQICPVGALTAKPYRFKARPWDLTEVESTCTRCSVGCRVTVESSRDQVLRLQGVDSDPVNWGWLCDKGRFGFEAMNSEQRLVAPLMRGEDGELSEVRWSEALASVASEVRRATEGRGPASVALIGGSRSTNEGAYAWAKLAKSVIGTDNCDAQLGDGLPAEAALGLPGLTIDELCAPGGTVLWMGPDPIEELPVLYLRLRHAVLEDGVRIVELGPRRSGLRDLVAHRVPVLPGRAAEALETLLSAGGDDQHPGASEALRAAGGDLRVVVGRQNLAESPASTIRALEVLRQAAPGVRFLVALPRGNVRGALEAGLAPGLLPGGAPLGSSTPEGWDRVPSERGLDTAGILEAAASGRIEVLFLLGADPLSDFPDRSLARRALAGARTVVAVTPLLDASAAGAHVVLPAAGFAEVDGTTTNLEGRVTPVRAKVTAAGTSRPDWSIASALGAHLGEAEALGASLADLATEMPLPAAPAESTVGEAPHFEGDTSPLPGQPGAARDGQVHGLERELELPSPGDAVAAPVDSYSLRLVVARRMYDRGTLLQASPSSSGLAPSGVARLNPADANPLGVTSGTRIRLSSPGGNLTVAAVADDSVARGTVLVHHNLEGADPGELVEASGGVCDVRVEVL
ncbi:MAG: NADH-quinone oxidoreductase subunit NuoG, partial [Microthrixaceae bacterium]